MNIESFSNALIELVHETARHARAWLKPLFFVGLLCGLSHYFTDGLIHRLGYVRWSSIVNPTWFQLSTLTMLGLLPICVLSAKFQRWYRSNFAPKYLEGLCFLAFFGSGLMQGCMIGEAARGDYVRTSLACLLSFSFPAILGVYATLSRTDRLIESQVAQYGLDINKPVCGSASAIANAVFRRFRFQKALAVLMLLMVFVMATKI
jgi:hypothetical protein